MSKIYDTIYWDYLYLFNIEKGCFFRVEKQEKIMYRIISIDDYFLFAEEIATGCIFPVGYVYSNCHRGMFKEFSGLCLGNFFIKCKVKAKEDFGKITFDEEFQKEVACSSSKRIEEYLSSRKNDEIFRTRMISFSINEYFWNRETVLGKIAEAKGVSKETSSNKKTLNIDLKEIQSFGFDLAEQENLCHVIGRENELQKIIETTVIKGKSILLIGEAGTGKTAIVEELARQIKLGINPWLSGKKIISINVNSLVAGTRYRGAFEENMQKLIEFARKNKGMVILFIDEIHALYGLGESEQNRCNDSLNILKPYLNNRDIVIIGATTIQEYRKYLVCDEAFCGRFDKLTIKPLEPNLIIDILREFLDYLSEKYGVAYIFSDPFLLLTRVVELTDMKHQLVYNNAQVSNIRLAKDVIENAFVRAVYKQKKEIYERDILGALSECEHISSVARERLQRELQEIDAGSRGEEQATEKIIPLSRALLKPNNK